MKRRLTGLILVVTLMVVLIGCGNSNSGSDKAGDATEKETPTEATEDTKATETADESDHQEIKTLRVQSMPNFNGVLLSYILDQGWAEGEGLVLEVELYANGAVANEALAAGLWDVGFQGPAYVFGSVNNEAKIIGTSSDTGGDTLFVRGDSEILGVQGYNPTYPDVYGDPELIKGATILFSAGTSTHQLSLEYLESMGVGAEEVDMVPMDFQMCEQTFQLGEGDIVALPTPWSTAVTTKYGWQPIATLQDFSATNTDVICSKEAYETMKPELTKFMQLCYRAADELEGDVELKINQIKKFYEENALEVTDDTIKEEASLRIFITSDVQKTMEYGKSEKDAADFYASIGQIEADQAEAFKNNIMDDIWKAALE